MRRRVLRGHNCQGTPGFTCMSTNTTSCSMNLWCLAHEFIEPSSSRCINPKLLLYAYLTMVTNHLPTTCKGDYTISGHWKGEEYNSSRYARRVLPRQPALCSHVRHQPYLTNNWYPTICCRDIREWCHAHAGLGVAYPMGNHHSPKSLQWNHLLHHIHISCDSESTVKAQPLY